MGRDCTARPVQCRAAYSLWSSLPRGSPSPALAETRRAAAQRAVARVIPLPPELELPLELLDALPQLVQAPHHHVPVEAAGGATVQATGGALASTSPPLTVVTPIPRSPLSSPHSSSHPSATHPASSPAPHSLSSPRGASVTLKTNPNTGGDAQQLPRHHRIAAAPISCACARARWALRMQFKASKSPCR